MARLSSDYNTHMAWSEYRQAEHWRGRAVAVLRDAQDAEHKHRLHGIIVGYDRAMAKVVERYGAPPASVVGG